MQIQHTDPVVVYCDNKSILYIASNPVFHERTKHIELDSHTVRDKIQVGVIHLLPIASKEQVADILTKYLQPGPFTDLQRKLGMLNIHSSLSGRVKVQNKDQSASEMTKSTEDATLVKAFATSIMVPAT